LPKAGIFAQNRLLAARNQPLETLQNGPGVLGLLSVVGGLFSIGKSGDDSPCMAKNGVLSG
jgi:hypothetical protein